MLPALLQILWNVWPLTLLVALIAALRPKGSAAQRFSRALTFVLLAWLAWTALYLFLVFLDSSIQPWLPQTWFWLSGLLLVGLAGLRFAWQRWQARRRLLAARDLAGLHALSPAAFEQLTAEVYRAQGCRVQVVGASGDHGLDLVMRSPHGEKWVAQCKRYAGRVGEPAVRDFYGAMLDAAAVQGFFITSGEFTAQAREWIKDKPIQLYDGPEFVRLLKSAQSARGWRRIFPASHAPSSPENPAQPPHRPSPQAASGNHDAGATDFSRSPAPPVLPAMPVLETPPEPAGQPLAAPAACPKCGAPMVLRTLRPGHHYWGCSRYPQCRAALQAE
jgi:restriction system protein